MSFIEAYDEFKIYASKRHKKQSFECLLYNFNANILSYFKDYALEDITSINIMKWQDLLQLHNYYIDKYQDNTFDYFIFGGKKPLAPTTINRYKKDACLKLLEQVSSIAPC